MERKVRTEEKTHSEGGKVKSSGAFISLALFRHARAEAENKITEVFLRLRSHSQGNPEF